jgi:hypothetical protein
MKKKITFFILYFTFFSSVLNASINETSPHMGIKINALSILQGIADAEFDLKIYKNFSLAFALSGGVIYLASNLKAGATIGGGIGGQWNISSDAFTNSFYLKPMVRFAYSGLVATNNNLWLIPSVGAGYEWFWPNGLSLSTGLDLFLPISLSKIKEKDTLLYFNFPIPLVTLALGYAW